MTTVLSQGVPALFATGRLEDIAASLSDVVLDTAVINAIGADKKLISAQRYGNSAWSSTARVSIMDRDETVHDYFVKVSFLSTALVDRLELTHL